MLSNYSGDATKTYTVQKAGIYLILVRGNASTTTSVPTITATDTTAVPTAKASGSAGAFVMLHKFAMYESGDTITINVTNFTGGGSYTNYNRVTIIKLK